MHITIDRTQGVPLYRQIVAQMRALILEGRLPPGSRLPSERVLASHLGLNRTTVVNAYRELAADGLVEGHVGRGTIVSGRPEQEAQPPPVPLAWSGLVRPCVRLLRNPLVEHVADLVSRPDTISLASGVPKTATSPHIHLEQTIHRVASSQAQALFEDSPAVGLMPLRTELSRRLAMKGFGKLSPRRILLVSGSQQGLYLVAQLLLEAGDAVLVEAPTYLGALEAFRAVGARLVEVPMDNQGMRVDAAERLLMHTDVRLIYTIPTFHNPTGAVMGRERRERLLALAQRHQVPILEDDLYGELFYDASPPAPIGAADREDCVLYLSGISSTLGPGLRLGWLAVPSALVDPLTALRRAMDLHPSNLIQGVVWELLSDGSLDAHLGWVRATYARRRDAMIAALEEWMPKEVTWNRPEGGFYVWCGLGESVRSSELLDVAAAEGVVFVPGSAFFPGGHGDCHLRLSFVHSSEEEIHEGVRRLARAIGRWDTRERQRPASPEAGRPVV